MRQILSLLLATILILPANPVSAQETDSSPTFVERIRNMGTEVERFLSLNAATSDGLVLEQETPATDESTEAERVRAILLRLERGTKVGVVFQDGETVQGRLVEITDTTFYLNVAMEKNRYIRREYGFDQVESLQYPGSPEEVHDIGLGKRVEILLLSGEKVRGRLSDITEQRFTLSLGKETNREFTFDEVTSVRKLGMPTSSKILIAAGVVGSVLGLLFLAVTEPEFFL